MRELVHGIAFAEDEGGGEGWNGIRTGCMD